MKMHPDFFACPIECKYGGFDFKRAKYCGECEHKKLDDDLRNKTLADWQKKLGKFADKYRFDDIYNLLLSIINYEDLPPEKISVKSNYFLSAYLVEKSIKDKTSQWERDKEDK